jgi:hypothetical protein
MFGPNLIASLTVSQTLRNLLTVLPGAEIRRQGASFFYFVCFRAATPACWWKMKGCGMLLRKPVQ